MDAIDKEIEASGKAVELVSYLIGKSPCWQDHGGERMGQTARDQLNGFLNREKSVGTPTKIISMDRPRYARLRTRNLNARAAGRHACSSHPIQPALWQTRPSAFRTAD